MPLNGITVSLRAPVLDNKEKLGLERVFENTFECCRSMQ